MPNKHFCQGPNCHTHVTQDRFLKSRGVIRGRYAYADRDRTPNSWKTLNKVDRLSLSDTDEKPKVMPKLRMMKVGGGQNIIFKGLTILVK